MEKTRLATMLMLTFLLFSCALCMGEEATSSSYVHYSIKGTANRFAVDSKTGEIQLANCIVTRLRNHRYRWEMPDAKINDPYRNEETVQRIFDLLDACAMLVIDKEKEAVQEGLEKGYFAYAGVEIDFQSLKGASRPPLYQKPGQGYGTIRLEPLSHVSDDFGPGFVYVHFALFTNSQKTFLNFYVQSSALRDLIMSMCQQDYPLDELRGAQSVTLLHCGDFDLYAIPRFNPNHPPTIEDAKELSALVDVLRSGKLLARPVAVDHCLLLRFLMPDLTIRAAWVAKPSPDMGPEEVIVMVGTRQYAVDAQRLGERVRLP